MFYKEYNPRKPLIFIHVPKCGGTSIQNQFKIWYGSNLYFNYYDEVKGKLPKKHKLKYGFLNLWKRNRCVFGHFNSNRGFGVSDMYPEIDQFISVIRNPREMVISNYFYLRNAVNWKDNSRVPNEISIYDYASTCEMNFLNHFPTKLTLSNYKEVITSQFIYIGIIEDYNTTMENIAHKLKKSSPNKEFFSNITERKENYDSAKIYEILEKRFPLEMEVYDFIKEIYAKI